MCRVVDDHRPGRLVDLEILTDLKIMVDRVENHNRQGKGVCFLRCSKTFGLDKVAK